MPYAIEMQVPGNQWETLRDYGLLAGTAQMEFDRLCEVPALFGVKYRLVRYSKEVLDMSDGER